MIGTGDSWPLVAIGDTGIAHGECQGLPSLKSSQRGQLPSANDSVQSAVHVGADQVSPPYWQLEHGCQCKTVGGIIRADRPFALQIIQLLRISIVQRAHKRIEAGR